MTNHIYAGTSKIASIDGDGVLTYNHEDHLGSSSLRTDSSGNVVKNIVYSANDMGQTSPGAGHDMSDVAPGWDGKLL